MKFVVQVVRYRVHCARGTSSSIVAILQFSTGRLFSVYAELSDLQETPTEGNRDRVRPVIRSQLVHQIFDMKIDGRLRNRQLIRNLFIAIAVSNQAENFEFPIREIIVPQMLSKASGYFRRHVPISAVNRSDHTQHFILRHTFENIAGGARPQRPLNIAVPVGSSQNDDAGAWKLSASGDECVNSIGAGKPKIHQGDVWAETAEFFQSLHTIARLSHQQHV